MPIYNVEQYLRKCVESLLLQDYDSYEIILVDDGSTDASGVIADELAVGESLEDAALQFRGRAERYSLEDAALQFRGRAERYSLEDASLQFRGESKKIRVIHQENRGLSGARNTGVLAAKGEYMCFVDSDDYWEPNVLGGLMAQVEKEDLDVLRFDYQNVRLFRGRAERYSLEDAALQFRGRAERYSLEDAALQFRGERYEVFEPNKEAHKHDMRTDVVDGVTYLNERMGYACYAVMYIVRRGLLIPTFSPHREEGGAMFTEGIHFEDVDWLPRMMLNAKRVNASQTIVYNYLMREGSITKVGKNVEKKRKNVEDCMGIVERLGQLHEHYPTCSWLRRMQSAMAVGVVHSVVTTFPHNRRAYVQRLKAIHAYPFVIANQGKTYARRARIMNISIALYSLLMKIRKIRK